jgi:spore maturation protein CgeB
MRLLKLGIYPRVYIDQFYAARPHLASEPYAVQLDALIGDCFGSSDFWTQALGDLGYETLDLIANAEPLQKRWATGHDLSYQEDDWLFEIALAQIKAFSPATLIVADYSTFSAAFLRQLRRECPSIQLIIGWCGAPYRDAEVFHEWDIVLSCIPELVEHFQSNGHHSFHLNHAFDERILEKVNDAQQPNVDFSFVGSVLKQNQFHLEREKILLSLLEQTDLRIWSHFPTNPSPTPNTFSPHSIARKMFQTARAFGVSARLLAATPFVRRAARLDSVTSGCQFVDSRIVRHSGPALYGLEMFQKLRDSRVTLNTHIDISPLSASNMRLFEATGVGSCLITDWKTNLAELFEPDIEVLTYRHPDECIEKVKYILDHESERCAIAAAGQCRTLSEHTFTSRVARIDEIINECLRREPAASHT